jgi:hypothetical protein
MLRADDAQVGVDDDARRARPPGVRAALELVQLCPQPLRSPQVVVVQEGDPRGAGNGEAGVSRPGDPGRLRVSNHRDRPSGERGEIRGGVVAGGVVDDDDLLPDATLTERARERALEQFSPVPSRHDDRDLRVDIRAGFDYDVSVRFYGVLDHEAEIIDLYVTRASAQEELKQLLRRAPEFDGKAELVLVDFARVDPLIERLN